MQQIERKNNSLFSLHSRISYGAGKTETIKGFSHPATSIPKIPGCALRSFLASAPEHIQTVCKKMIAEYRITYSAVSERSLLQYVVSDLLNPSMPETILHRLVASSPSTPGEVLEELRGCGHSDILIRIAENPNVREETLIELACDPDAQVRCAVVENIKTPITAVWQLSTDPSADVRYRQAESLTSPLRILVRHLSDHNPYIAHRARKTLEMHGFPTSIDQ